MSTQQDQAEKPFSIKWFKNRLAKAIKSADKRYTPQVNVTLPINRYFDWMGRTGGFYAEIEELHKKCADLTEQELHLTNDLVKHGFLNASQQSQIRTDLNFLWNRLGSLKKVRLKTIDYISIKRRVERLSTLLEKPDESLRELRFRKIEDPKEDQSDASPTPTSSTPLKSDVVTQLNYRLGKLTEFVRNIDELLITLPAKLSNEPAILLLGEAGMGKTHLLCDLAQRRTNAGYPTLLILGQQLTHMDDPLAAIVDHLGLKISKNEFLNELETLANKKRKRILILIDAINEGDRKSWKRNFNATLKAVLRRKGIGIVFSCRSPFEKTTIPKHTTISRLSHTGFSENELDALKVYFKHYRIPLPEIPLLADEFTNPLFLKIFCESLAKATIKKKHARIKEIASGQEGLLNIFEDFIIERSRRVAPKFNLAPPAIWGIIKDGFASKMADLTRSWLTIREAHAVLTKYKVNPAMRRQLLQTLANEGLITEDVYSDYATRKTFEIIRLPYQKFSDHLIARYLLKKYLDPKDLTHSLRPGSVLGDIVFPSKYPRKEPGLVGALIMEFPQWTRNQGELLDFRSQVDGEIASLFLDGLQWRRSTCFNKSTGKYFGWFLHNKDLKDHTLSIAVALATKPGHPYNANILARYLRQFKMVQRDLYWTEFLRRQHDASSAYRTIFWIEAHQDRVLSVDYATNYIELIKWFLTSTNRQFRDRSTRCLYYIGCQHPQILFESTINSLTENDPYIPERMFAASCGVVMALHYSPLNSDFHNFILRPFALHIYQSMFREGAPYRTTHILMRDYAKMIIDIAILHVPNILNSHQQALIRHPFKATRFNRWRRSKERKQPSVPGPMQMDFHNYTLGSLVRGRQNYDFGNEEFKKVEENIFWRIYKLGYSEILFARIDKGIGNDHWNSGNATKVDRYGKKYCWIAYYELAGYRADRGLKKFDDGRITGVDIEPSFPSAPPNINVIKSDLIGKQITSTAKWIEHGPTPDVRPFLRKNALNGEDGPWVLLDAFIEQQHPETNKALFMFVRGFFVKPTDIEPISRYLGSKAQPRSSFGTLPEPETTHYTFAGEIPWSDNFPFAATPVQIQLPTGRKITEQTPISGAHTLKIGDELISFYSPEDIARGYTELVRDELITFSVELPVREHVWESYHTSLAPGLSEYVLSKEIAHFFGLTSRPSTFDLFDSGGRRVSLACRFGSTYGPRQDLIFARKSLLTTYLRKKQLSLVWIVWGEREFKSKEFTDRERFSKEHPAYVPFSYLVPK